MYNTDFYSEYDQECKNFLIQIYYGKISTGIYYPLTFRNT